MWNNKKKIRENFFPCVTPPFFYTKILMQFHKKKKKKISKKKKKNLDTPKYIFAPCFTHFIFVLNYYYYFLLNVWNWVQKSLHRTIFSSFLIEVFCTERIKKFHVKMFHAWNKKLQDGKIFFRIIFFSFFHVRVWVKKKVWSHKHRREKTFRSDVENHQNKQFSTSITLSEYFKIK